MGALPPRLEVQGARLLPAADEAELGARRVALEVALLPLLSGSVVVDSLVVEGARLELVRDEDGFALPISPPAEEASEPAGSDPANAEDASERAGGEAAADPIDLALNDVRLEDARLVLVDETLAPPGRIVLEGFGARARGRLDPTAPLALQAEGSLESGGDLALEAEGTLAGAWQARVTLATLALGPLAPWLADLELGALEGDLDLTVDATGEDSTPHGARHRPRRAAPACGARRPHVGRRPSRDAGAHRARRRAGGPALPRPRRCPGAGGGRPRQARRRCVRARSCPSTWTTPATCT